MVTNKDEYGNWHGHSLKARIGKANTFEEISYKWTSKLSTVPVG